ncbi:MAG: hypothetical protein Q7T66_17955 [Herminiimonas sp.]|nr:hypothetical protein [Herminiimonas sp.]MDO9422550.1 hypothetical protein [Herminiimonas sp.]
MANKNGLGLPKPSCKKTPFYRVTIRMDQPCLKHLASFDQIKRDGLCASI